MNQCTKPIQKIEQIGYRKVSRALTKWEEIEKSPLLFRILGALIIY